MKWKIPASCASALIAGAMTSLTPSVSYAVLVQGFETGLPVGSTTGDAQTTGTFQSIAPFQGSNQLLLTTINQTSDGIAPFSVNAVTVNAVAAFVGVTVGTLQFSPTNTGKEGSAFKMTLALNVGDVLTFNYDFLTAEDITDPLAPQDFGFASLVLAGSLVNYQILGNTSAAVLTSTGPTFFNQTGYKPYTFTITTAGTYTLGIGVLDAKNLATQSGLLVDNISVTSAVPEPSTIGLGFAGAALLIALRRRIKSS